VDFSQKVQKACEKIREMLELKQASLGIETRIELAEKLQYYCDEGVTIDHNNLSGYLRKRKNGTYVFPTIEKLKAIGAFLGYNLSEFYDLLFSNSDSEGEVQKKIADNKEHLSTIFIQKMGELKKEEKIRIHQLITEELYRTLEKC